MLGLDNLRGENMDPMAGFSAMMDSFQRAHYAAYPTQGAFTPWPMLPANLSIPQHPPSMQNSYQQHPMMPPVTQSMTSQSLPNAAYMTSSAQTAPQQIPHLQSLPSEYSAPGIHKGDAKSPPSPSMPASSSRERFSYTRYQLELLNVIYEKIRYPNCTQKHLIGKRVGITKDQVKIWFQNRRRKDITGKKCAQDSNTGPQQVPDDVRQGVVQELLSHKKEPSKKTADSIKEYNKKVGVQKRIHEDNLPDSDASASKRLRHPSQESSTSGSKHPPPLPISSTHLPEIYFANDTSPQGSMVSEVQSYGLSRSSPHSRSAESTSFSSDHSAYQIASVESSNPSTPYNPDDSTGSITSPAQPPLTIVPTIHELDMNAPPNAIALPLETAVLERPRSIESPALGPHIEGAQTQSSTASDDDTRHAINKVSEKALKDSKVNNNHEAPPNKIAPPSEKINFDVSKHTQHQPLSIMIPKKKDEVNKTQTQVTHEPLANDLSSFTSCDSLLIPSSAQLFTSQNTQPWMVSPYQTAGNTHVPSDDKLHIQAHYDNQRMSSVTNKHVSSEYPDTAGFYEKFLGSYMYGFQQQSDGSNFNTHDRGYNFNTQHPMAPYMAQNYHVPYTPYDLPSDLSRKKSY